MNHLDGIPNPISLLFFQNEDMKGNESDTAIKHCIKVNDILKAACGSNGSILIKQMNKEKKSSNSGWNKDYIL